MVDSGADGTLLPRSILPGLGLDPSTDLVPTPTGSGGAGGTNFPTWTTSQPIAGQILAFPPTGGQMLWGPVMTLQPVFADGQHALFGRKDFFPYFAIVFARDPTLGPIFHLSY